MKDKTCSTKLNTLDNFKKFTYKIVLIRQCFIPSFPKGRLY